MQCGRLRGAYLGCERGAVRGGLRGVHGERGSHAHGANVRVLLDGDTEAQGKGGGVVRVLHALHVEGCARRDPSLERLLQDAKDECVAQCE